MAHTLILLRHGTSEWNTKNLFTGWVDVDLTESGRGEARRAGQLLKEMGVLPDIVFTSVLRRAIYTATIALDEAERFWVDARRSWRLNERHYGALQGKSKPQVREEFGDEQFALWRRSFDVPPPPIGRDDPCSQVGDPRYADLGDSLPHTEALEDVIERLIPYWERDIVPELRANKTVLIAAHGNSLRALVKHLDGISRDGIAELNIPTGVPLVYELDEDDLQPLNPGGRYVDPEAARASIEAVANQGKK